ncbi:MAG: LPD38 domain-containing protein [Leucobacter sp.]
MSILDLERILMGDEPETSAAPEAPAAPARRKAVSILDLESSLDELPAAPAQAIPIAAEDDRPGPQRALDLDRGVTSSLIRAMGDSVRTLAQGASSLNDAAIQGTGVLPGEERLLEPLRRRREERIRQHEVTGRVLDAEGKDPSGLPPPEDPVARDRRERIERSTRQGRAIREAVEPVAEFFDEGAKIYSDSMTEEGKQLGETDQFEGNVIEVLKGDAPISSLGLTDEASAAGVMQHVANSLGTTVWALAVGRVTGSHAAAGAAGGLAAGAEGAEVARDRIGQLSDEQLSQDSPLFASLVADGVDPATAREHVTQRAEEAAAVLQALVAGAGDTFTSRLIGGAFRPFEKLGGAATRVGAKTLAGMGEESAQEFTEGLAAERGINTVVDTPYGEDSFSNLALGALAGGTITGTASTGRELLRPREQASPDPEQESVDPSQSVDVIASYISRRPAGEAAAYVDHLRQQDEQLATAVEAILGSPEALATADQAFTAAATPDVLSGLDSFFAPVTTTTEGLADAETGTSSSAPDTGTDGTIPSGPFSDTGGIADDGLLPAGASEQLVPDVVEGEQLLQPAVPAAETSGETTPTVDPVTPPPVKTDAEVRAEIVDALKRMLQETGVIEEGETVVLPPPATVTPEMEALKGVADKLGVQIVFADVGGQLSTDTGRALDTGGFNGAFVRPGLVVLDSKADGAALWKAATHEWTHDLERRAPDLYATLRDVAKRNSTTRSQQLWASNLAKHGESRVDSEIVAEAISEQGSPEFWQQVFEEAGDRTTAQRIYDSLQQLWDKLLAAFDQRFFVTDRKAIETTRAAAQKAYVEFVRRVEAGRAQPAGAPAAAQTAQSTPASVAEAPAPAPAPAAASTQVGLPVPTGRGAPKRMLFPDRAAANLYEAGAKQKSGPARDYRNRVIAAAKALPPKQMTGEAPAPESTRAPRAERDYQPLYEDPSYDEDVTPQDLQQELADETRPVTAEEVPALSRAHNALTQRIADGKPVSRGELVAQPEVRRVYDELTEARKRAAKIKVEFDKEVQAIAEAIGAKALLADVKSQHRAFAKIWTDYEGDVSKIKDLVRATIEVDFIEDVQGAINAVMAHFPPGSVTLKRNGYADDAIVASNQYRDVFFNVRYRGMTVELQVNIPEMLEAKSRMHREYEIEQKGWRAVKSGTLTEEIERQMVAAIAAQAPKYSAAHSANGLRRRGTGRGIDRNVASSMGDPSESIVEGVKNRGPSDHHATGSSSDRGLPAIPPLGSGGRETGTSLQSQKVVPSGNESGSLVGSDTTGTSDVDTEIVTGESGTEYPARKGGESNADYLHRVVDKMPMPPSLPEDYERYFEIGPDDRIVPIEQLVPSKDLKTRADTNSPKRMIAAYDGQVDKRAPISVRENADGTFQIVDGHGTFIGAQRYGWKALPVRVKGEQAKQQTEQSQLSRDITQTPEFKRWFGDSKVVDENGAPLRMYRGMRAAGEVEAFRPASYFTEDPSEASDYAAGDEGAVHPVYVSIRNPYEASDEIDDENRSELTQIDEAYAEELAAQGYDGVVAYRNGQTLWAIPFRPEQVKSVFNAGTFDPGSPNILLSRNVQRFAESAIAGRQSVDSVPLVPMQPQVEMAAALFKLDGYGRNRPVVLSGGDVRHITRRHPDISPEMLAELPGLLQRPRAVWYSPKPNDSVNMLLARRDDDGNPLLAVLKPRIGKAGQKELRVVDVRTVYGLMESARTVVEALASGRMAWMPKVEVDRVKGLLAVPAGSPPQSGAAAFRGPRSSPRPEPDSLRNPGLPRLPGLRDRVASVASDEALANYRDGNPTWVHDLETIAIPQDWRGRVAGVQFSRNTTVSPLQEYVSEEEAQGRVRRREKREPGTGAPVNERKVFEKNGIPFAVGRITHQDWIDRVNALNSPEELREARNWYAQLHATLEPIFGEQSSRYALAWLLSQKRASPSKGMLNVLRASDMVAGRPGPVGAGLNERALRAVLGGEMPESAIGLKLLDFVDSELGLDTRTAVRGDPRGRQPAAIDVWAQRDIGFVDDTVHEYVRKTYGPQAAASLTVDRTLNKEPQYEYGVDFYNDLAEHLNATGFDGGGWTAREVQAVGWTTMQKAMGIKAEFVSDIIGVNTRRISIGLAPGAGSPLEKQLAGREIPLPIARREINRLAKMAGVNVLQNVSGVGAYMAYVEGSIQIDAFASPESVANFMDMVGYVFQQTEVIYTRPMKSGNRMGIDILGPALKDPKVAAEFFGKMLEAMPTKGGQPIAPGFQQVTVNGVPGIRLLNFVGNWNEVQQLQIMDAANVAAEAVDIDLVDAHSYPTEIGSTKHDWTADPTGSSYLDSLAQRGRDREARELQRRYVPSRFDLTERPLLSRSTERGGSGAVPQERGVAAGLPRYGQPREHAISVLGVHYSRQPRDTLSGYYYGQGLKGAEARRLVGADPRLQSRIHFYVDEGAGIQPEAGVGTQAHLLHLDNLYDVIPDPLGLRAQYRGDPNGWELAIVEAGFDGYYAKGMGVAVLLGNHTVRPQQAGEGYRGEVQLSRAGVEKVLRGESEVAQIISDTSPQALMAAGVEKRLRITISPRVIRKLATGKDGERAVLSPAQIAALPALLQSPAAVFQSATDPQSAVAVLGVRLEGAPIVVSIVRGADRRAELTYEDGTSLKSDGASNDISSAYPKTGERWLSEWLDRALLRYWDEKKTASVLPGRQVQFLTGVSNTKRSGKTVYTPETVVNLRRPQLSRNVPIPGSRFTLPARSRREQISNAIANRYSRVQAVQEEVVRQGGVLTDQSRVNTAGTRMYRRAAQRLEWFRKEVVEKTVRKAAAKNISLDDVALYLYAAHAEERNKQIARINARFPDGGSGMKTADARQLLGQLRSRADFKDLKAIADEIQQITKRTQNVLVGSGLVDAAQVAAWNKTYGYYVPLKGFENIDELGQRVAGGFDLRQDFARRAKGRASRAGQVIENILADYERAVLLAEQNEVRKTFLRFVKDNPDDELWEVDRVVLVPQYRKSGIAGMLGEVQYQAKKDDGRSTLPVRVAGKTVNIYIKDPALLDDLEMRGFLDGKSEVMRKVLSSFMLVNRTLAKFWTALSPTFVLTNAARDLQTALLNTGIEQGGKSALRMARDIVPAVMGIARAEFTGNWTGGAAQYERWYNEFRAEGGKMGHLGIETIEDRQKKVLDTFRDAQATWQNPQGWFRKARKGVRAAEDFVMALNTSIENAARVAAYAEARRSGKSKEEAVAIAGDITVDFARRGKLTPLFGALYLFWNPAVQGGIRTMKAVNTPKGRMVAAGLVGLGYLLALMGSMVLGEDDEPIWDKPHLDSAKQRSLLFVRPDGTTVAVPLPYGWGFFVTLGYTLRDLQDSRKSMGRIALDVMDSLVQHFSPMGSMDSSPTFFAPTVIDPVMVISTERRESGLPLMPEQPSWGAPLPDSERYFTATHGTAVQRFTEWLNRATGGSASRPGMIDISPETIRYLTTFATGGAGNFVTDTATMLGLLSEGINPLEKNKVPIASSFYRRPTIRGDQAAYYENAREAKIALAEWKEFYATGNEAIADRVRENEGIARLGHALQTYQKALSELRKAEVAVIEDEGLSVKEKDERRKEIDELKQRLYVDFNRAFYAELDYRDGKR